MPGQVTAIKLPSELPEWPWVHRLLSEALLLFEQGHLGFQHLRKAAQLVHVKDATENQNEHRSEHSKSGGFPCTEQKSGSSPGGDLLTSVFGGLERFVLTQCNPQTRYRILTLTLPTVIRYALVASCLDLSEQLTAELSLHGSDCSLTVWQFSSLLACGILGLLRPSPTLSMFDSFCSENVLGDLSRPEHYERLQSILRFFDSVADSNKATGQIHFMHKRGSKLEEIQPADWLQCDTLLCPMKVQCTPQSCRSSVADGEIIIFPSGQKQCGYCPELEASQKVMEALHTRTSPAHIYTHQISTGSSTNVVVCSVYSPLVAAPRLGLTELERCQLETFRRLSDLLASFSVVLPHETDPGCCADFIAGARGVFEAMDTDSYEMSSILSSISTSSMDHTAQNEGVPSRLLAFSQQMSENILNEALQISTNRGSIVSGTRPKVPRSTAQPTSKKSGAPHTTTLRQQIHPEPRQDFVDIPVEVEFGDSVEMEVNIGMEASESPFPVGAGPPPFKKILLVEESDESEERRFTPHSVVGACIMEESSRDSSVESSPVSPDYMAKVNDSEGLSVADGACARSGSDQMESTPVEVETADSASVAESLLQSFADDFVKTLIPGGPSAAEKTAISDLSGSVLHGVVTGVGLPNQSLGVSSELTQQSSTGRLADLESPGQGSSSPEVYSRDDSMEPHAIEKSSPGYFRSAVEEIVDNMLSMAFRSGYTEIKAKLANSSSQVQDCNRISAVENYVSGLVDDTFDAAMYKIREYIAEMSRPEGCRSVRVMGGVYMSDKDLDREWNAQLTAFVDDFVMNVLEEALYISKTQNPEVRRKDRRLHTCRSTESSYSRVPSIQEQAEVDNSLPVPPLSQTIGASRQGHDSKYFEVEFAVDFHNSRLNDNRRGSGASNRSFLRADHSSGSSRRGSNEDENIRLGWRRSSTGFRDSVLSEFEDELVHSDISTPSLNMFSAAPVASTDVPSKRRASEPTGRRRVSNDFQTKLDKKRARSVDSTSSRKVILQWLDGQSTSSSSNLSASSRNRTSSHLDWFAQDLLVEAFNDAFVALFGRNYEELSECQDLGACSRRPETIAESVVQFAESVSKAILEECYQDITTQTARASSESAPDDFYSMADSQDEYMDALDVPLAQLESVAETFSTQILKEAIDIMKEDFHRYTQACLLYVTQDTQMQVLLRWAGATQAGLPGVICCTLGSSQLKQLSSVVLLIRENRYSVADLVHLMFTYLEEKSQSLTEETPFVYIISRLGDM